VPLRCWLALCGRSPLSLSNDTNRHALFVTTTAQQLRNCTDILALALVEDQSRSDDDPLPPPHTRPNVKWSKILINGTPTGDSADECHEALSSENPAYASLLVTQKPSWVRPPSHYSAGSSSSLVVAFEDPDGTVIKMLLTEKHLYAFGARVTVKRWKQRPPQPKALPPLPAANTPPPPSSTPPPHWLLGPHTPTALSPFPLPASPPSVSMMLPATARSPQKRKAPVLSPPDHRTNPQPSKKFAPGPSNPR
jgi:hypothetical protein